MDDQTINKITDIARLLARRYGYASEEDDIIQFVLITYLETPTRRSKVWQIVTDYVNKYHGRKLTAPGLSKLRFTRTVDADLTKLPSNNQINHSIWEVIYNTGLSEWEQMLLHRFYVEGYTHDEIGRRCGKSRPCVVRAINNIKNKLRILMGLPKNMKWVS